MAHQRHALLIGVRFSPRIFHHPCGRVRNEYFQLSSDDDVDLMRDLLVDRFYFPRRNVRVLKTEEATREAILAAVDQLIERVTSDDVVVLYYSGHGSRMRDAAAPGGWRETLVAFDSGRSERQAKECTSYPESGCEDLWSFEEVPPGEEDLCGPRADRTPRGDDENQDVQDREIDDWVRRLNQKTPYVSLIFDCCHSGSLHRPAGAAREAVPDFRPADGGDPPSHRAGSRTGDPEGTGSGWLPVARRRMVMVAACERSEFSWERRKEPSHGLFTYELCAALSELGPEASWIDVLEAVSPAIRKERLDQHPQMEGEIDLKVLGRTRVRAKNYLPVVAAGSGVVDLWGGAAHGVAAGSVWTIRPPGTRSRHLGEEVARVRIELVRPATCRGRVVEETADPIEADPIEVGQRAFLLEHTLPAPALEVVVTAPEDRRSKLVEMLGRSKHLAVVEEEVIAHCLAPRDPVGPGDPLPFLGPLAESTLAVVDRAGQLQARPRFDDDLGVELLAQDLVKLARFKGLQHLENPDPESLLRGRVDLRILLRREPEQPLEPATDDEEYGFVVVEDRERVDFEIENKHDQDVWVSLVQFDCDHSISVLMPLRGHPYFRRGGKKLTPGQVWRLGRDYYRMPDGVRQFLPEGFPWPAAEGEPQDVSVTHFKLMVTSVSADFEFLEQEDTRYLPKHPLEELALLYHSNRGTRRVLLPPEDIAEDEDWTVVTKSLGIRRRQKT